MKQTILFPTFVSYDTLWDEIIDIALGNNIYNQVYWGPGGVSVGNLGRLAMATLHTKGNTTWTATEELTNVFAKAKAEIDAYRLSCVSIAFGTYNNHTVTSTGYEIYTHGSNTYKLLRILDGDTWTYRYVDMSGICPSTITRVYPLGG